MALAGDHAQVLVGGYELTGDLQRVTLDGSRKMYDVTALSDTVHNFIGGQRTMRFDHNGYMNSDAARSHPVLNSVGIEGGVVSVLLGSNAPPANGDVVFTLNGLQGSYDTMPEVGKFVPSPHALPMRADRAAGERCWQSR